MDALTDKHYRSTDYKCRYIGNPIYYNNIDKKYIMGIGSNVFKNSEWIPHKVAESDTLDYIALKYWGNPTLWWILAYFNDIQDSLIKLSDKYDIIKVPNPSSVEFGNER